MFSENIQHFGNFYDINLKVGTFNGKNLQIQTFLKHFGISKKKIKKLRIFILNLFILLYRKMKLKINLRYLEQNLISETNKILEYGKEEFF